MHAPNTQLEKVLRRALGAAGILVGYQHKYRRHGCGHIEAATDDGIRRCPIDERKMWVTSVVRPIRFHDLRHTTGSLLTAYSSHRDHRVRAIAIGSSRAS